eukprot:COSAG02_NODE_5118_length_4612_cov_48.722136_3_plen_374_part_00
MHGIPEPGVWSDPNSRIVRLATVRWLESWAWHATGHLVKMFKWLADLWMSDGAPGVAVIYNMYELIAALVCHNGGQQFIDQLKFKLIWPEDPDSDYSGGDGPRGDDWVDTLVEEVLFRGDDAISRAMQAHVVTMERRMQDEQAHTDTRESTSDAPTGLEDDFADMDIDGPVADAPPQRHGDSSDSEIEEVLSRGALARLATAKATQAPQPAAPQHAAAPQPTVAGAPQPAAPQPAAAPQPTVAGAPQPAARVGGRRQREARKSRRKLCARAGQPGHEGCTRERIDELKAQYEAKYGKTARGNGSNCAVWLQEQISSGAAATYRSKRYCDKHPGCTKQEVDRLKEIFRQKTGKTANGPGSNCALRLTERIARLS